jgi:peroxiredoxin
LGSWVIAAVVIGAALFAVILSPDAPPPVIRGVPAPHFELARLDTDESFSMAGLRDRVVLINFWATWCKPCEDEMPAMERLYRKLGAEGFELLAISVDDSPAPVRAFRDRMGLSFPILMDSEQEVAELYQTFRYPESLLVDRDGIVIERYIGPRDWDARPYVERIQRLLHESG